MFTVSMTTQPPEVNLDDEPQLVVDEVYDAICFHVSMQKERPCELPTMFGNPLKMDGTTKDKKSEK